MEQHRTQHKMIFFYSNTFCSICLGCSVRYTESRLIISYCNTEIANIQMQSVFNLAFYIQENKMHSKEQNKFERCSTTHNSKLD